MGERDLLFVMRTTLRALSTIAVIAVAVLAPAPASAAPAGGDLLLSADGIHFSESYRGELFHEVGAMVPGDSQDGRFWVRNATSEIAYLRVGIGSVGTSTVKFLESLRMTAGAGDAESGELSLTTSLVCTSLLAPIPLAAGEDVRVDLTVGLDPAAEVETQDASTDITMVASLSNAAPVEFGDDVCRGDFEAIPAVEPSATPSPAATATEPVVAAPSQVDDNTVHWHEEYLVLIPLLAFAGGAATRYLAGRLRPRDPSHPRGITEP